MELDRDHLALELGRLATRSRAEVEGALPRPRPDDEPGELGATALRPDQALVQRLLVDALDVQRVRQIQVGPTFDRAGLPAVQADDAFRRLVLRAHQRERFLLAELLPPQLGDPVRVGVLERRSVRIVLGQGSEQRAMPSDSLRITAFVNGTARSRRAERTSSTVSFTAACGGTSV